MKLEFSQQILKTTQMLNYMKICPVVAELFHADGRADRRTERRDEANSRFSQFCERAFLLSVTRSVRIRELTAIISQYSNNWFYN
jgi:hypothetical protein